MAVWKICTPHREVSPSFLFCLICVFRFSFIGLPRSHKYVASCEEIIAHATKPQGADLRDYLSVVFLSMCLWFLCVCVCVCVCVCGRLCCVGCWNVVYSEGQSVSSHWLVKVLRHAVRKFSNARCLECYLTVETEVSVKRHGQMVMSIVYHYCGN